MNSELQAMLVECEKELEDIECPLTIYSDLWKLKYPKEEDRIKAIKTKKLNITLVDACTYINNLFHLNH